MQEEPPKRTIFTIIENEHLPFDYHYYKDGTYITDADPASIALAEELGYIKIVKEGIPYDLGRFSGGPEPILNNGLQFVSPGDDNIRNIKGAHLNIEEFGDWKCLRCERITHIPVEPGKTIIKPYECQNDVCGRKGPFKEQFPLDLVKPIWKLPLAPIETTGTEVYTDIYNFVKKYLVLKEDEYHISTLWIMASWLADDFQTCPYLCIIAPKSSGKTQVLSVLNELAYRAVSAISVTAASLFRAIELWHITLLIDEAEYQIKQDTEAGQALYGCLNGGYKRGSYAIRIEGDNTNRMPATYEVFGFKAIATTKLFHPTLESRSIIFSMSQGIPQKILIDTTEATVLRSKLLFWRFETLGKLPIVLPDSNTGRLIEMFIPLFTIAQVLKNKEGVKKPISYESLVGLLKNKLKEMESQRKEEERESLEARILEQILVLREQALNAAKDAKDYITVKQIADGLNGDDHGENTLTTQKIGSKLKVMGIRTRHTMYGNIISFYEDETKKCIDELEKRYIK